MGDITSQVTAAAVVSFLIGLLKNSSWFPYLSRETTRLNRIAAVALSGLASLGIHGTFSRQTGTLVITGLTLTAVATGFYHWVTQFALTHGWFKATSSADQIYELLKTALDRIGTLEKQSAGAGVSLPVPALAAQKTP